MNAVKTFIDTNVLVYAFTASEPEKQKIAIKFLDDCLPVISTQVIKEFTNVLLIKTNISVQEIRETISEIIDIADLVNEEPGHIFDSFDIHRRYQYSFYDSLIIATAIKSKCSVLLSEDMQDKQIIDDYLEIINPFNIN